MSSRRILSLAVALLATAWVPATAAAQQSTPTDQPAPTTPPPAAAPAPADTATPTVTAQPETVAAPAPKGKMGEEIVVTGSRIRRKDLTTPAPVTVLSREQVQASGKVSIGDFLQSMPEQGNALNTSVNNGGDGSIRVGLRGLGDNRTLVLLNGRRMVYTGLGADASVDLSTIPTSSVERIEVLKDGASAVYGSDAIAGVVNIITRKRYNGAEANVYLGTSQHGGGTTWTVNGTAGHADEKGSIMVSLEYFRQEPIMGDQRGWASKPLGYDATGFNSPDGKTGEYQSFSSGTMPNGAIDITTAKNTGAVGNDTYQQVTAAFPGKTYFIHDPNDPRSVAGWRPVIQAANTAAPGQPPNGDYYNANPANYIVVPSQRISLFTTGDYKLGDIARAYFEGMYSNRQSKRLLAPEPFSNSTATFPAPLSAQSYYNPFGVDASNWRKRMVDFGGRISDWDVETYRVVAGLDGTLPDAAGPLAGWFWDAHFNYGRSVAPLNNTGNLYLPGLAAAVGPSFKNGSGQVQCGTAASPISLEKCVPLDVFNLNGPYTQAMKENLTYNGPEYGLNQMFAVGLNISGELYQLPTADRAIGVAAGYDYNSVMGRYLPNPIVALGLSSTNAAKPTSGGYFSNAGYLEVNIPVLSRLPGAEALELTAAGRLFSYSTFGTDFTYKLGARWTPIPDITVRGTYSTAYRAPNVGELYSGQGQSFTSANDPCSAPGAPATCGSAQNVPPKVTQVPATVGGNPKLQPETAKIWTLGVVLEPRWVKNLTFTADYYNIKIDKTIGTVGTQLILSSCYDPATNPKYCNLVTRDVSSMQITNVQDTLQNIGGYSTSGIDLAGRYSLPAADYGRFTLVGDATWLNHFDITQADGSIISGRGNYDYITQFPNSGVGGALPAWKVNAAINWLAAPGTSIAGLGAVFSMHFIGAWKECGSSTGDFSSGSGLCYVDNTYQRHIPIWASFDLFVSYGFTTVAGKTSVGAGVSNMFDADPAKIYNASQFNSDGTLYDFMGRFFYARISQSL